MRAGVLTVGLLVLLAGCQGGLSTPAAPTVTVTPAPYVAAPGLTVSGIEDVTTLAAAHERALRGRSYTVRLNHTFYRPNGSVRGGTVTRIEVGPAHERFLLTSLTFGDYPFDGTSEPAIAVWSNGTTTLLRRDYTDRTVYRAYESADTGWDNAPPDANTIRTYLGLAGESNVSEIVRGGERVYRVTARRGDSRSVRAIVKPSGLVWEFTANRPATSPVRINVDGRSTFRVQYTAIGDTVVSEPPWLGEAIRVTRNQTYVGQG